MGNAGKKNNTNSRDERLRTDVAVRTVRRDETDETPDTGDLRTPSPVRPAASAAAAAAAAPIAARPVAGWREIIGMRTSGQRAVRGSVICDAEP